MKNLTADLDTAFKKMMAAIKSNAPEAEYRKLAAAYYAELKKLGIENPDYKPPQNS